MGVYVQLKKNNWRILTIGIGTPLNGSGKSLQKQKVLKSVYV